jgi:hypothetical protein
VSTPPRWVLKAVSLNSIPDTISVANKSPCFLLTARLWDRVMDDTTRKAFSSSDVPHPQSVRRPQHCKNVASDKTEVFARRAQRKISPDSEPTAQSQLQLIVYGATT